MSYNLVDSTTGELTRVAGGGFSIPVGTLIQQYKKKPISGYLYCDGSTFDENVYPALYLYLGSNVLPVYRECVMVGAEENTTDTIAAHDVYGEGEFKDDQFQGHGHALNGNAGGMVYGDNTRGFSAGSANNATFEEYPSAVYPISDGKNGTPRVGSTTHGKQKAVYIYIKATSGLAENQQDNVLRDVKDYVDNSNSYSTEEKVVGTWIDGKPIYRIILTNTEIIVGDQASWGGLQSTVASLNIDNCIECKGIATNGFRHIQFLSNNGFIAYHPGIELDGKIILEYTKTTD